MNDPRVTRREDGALEVSCPSSLLAFALRELPRLLADDAPGIAERIAATPHPDDAAATAEWHRLNAPELAHLFRSSRDLVISDLTTLRHREGEGFVLRIPERNRTAWLSALAAARVAQGEAHGVEAKDMDRALDPVLGTPKDRALLTIHMLAWMQGLLLDGPEPAGTTGG